MSESAYYLGYKDPRIRTMLNVRVPDELAAELRAMAEQEGRTVSDIVRTTLNKEIRS